MTAQGVLGDHWPGNLLRAIPAGFCVAALVSLLPNARSFEIWVIVIPTCIIALGGFAHVVVA